MKKVFDALKAKIIQCKCPICGKEYKAKIVTKHPADKILEMVCKDCEEITKKDTKDKVRIGKWKEVTPKNYQNTDPSALPDHKAFEAAITWEYGSNGLILVGPTGTGKSRTAYLLLQRLMLDGYDVMPFKPLEFGHECIKRFTSDTWVHWIEYLYTVDVLFFDDFAKEPLTDRVESELFGVIEHRTANKLPIIATMNYTGAAIEDIADHRGPMIVRRLRDFCDAVSFRRSAKK